ncbi:MAG: hypothetical protein ACI4TB_03655 [Lachnospiraceae bacterium]
MKKKKNAKQIVALIAVVLLVAMYIVTLIAAVFDSTASGMLFRICLVCTVAIPILAWIYIWLYGQMTGKKTIADLNLMQDPERPSEKAQEKTEDTQ